MKQRCEAELAGKSQFFPRFSCPKFSFKSSHSVTTRNGSFQNLKFKLINKTPTSVLSRLGVSSSTNLFSFQQMLLLCRWLLCRVTRWYHNNICIRQLDIRLCDAIVLFLGNPTPTVLRSVLEFNSVQKAQVNCPNLLVHDCSGDLLFCLHHINMHTTA